jgi:uncharacterized Zn-finger protein
VKLKEDAREEKIQCMYCSAYVKNVDQLNIHILRSHLDKRVQCPILKCFSSFETVEERDAHLIQDHNKRKGFHCIICNKFLQDHKAQWSHMKVHKNVIRCNHKLCPLYFKTREEQKLHTQQVHEQQENQMQCLYCGFWIRKSTFRFHVARKHKTDAIKCIKVHCNTYFLSESGRQEHMKKVHLAERIKKKRTCFYCGKVYTAASLTNHVNAMHSDISIKCKIFKCNSYFHSKQELQRHFDERHKDAEKQKKINCAHCSYKTNDRVCFTQHFNIMHGTAKFKCARCPIGARSRRFYKSKMALKIHMDKVHSGEETCPHCMQKMSMKVKKDHLQSDFCIRCNTKRLCAGLMKIHRQECNPRNKNTVKA